MSNFYKNNIQKNSEKNFLNPALLHHAFLRTNIETHNLRDKRIILRADLNIPLACSCAPQQCIHKLQALLPTIDLLLAKQAKIFILTHLDNPQGEDPAYSTELLLPYFKTHGYNIGFEPDILDTEKITANDYFDKVDIVLGENIRYFAEETNLSTETARLHAKAFARKLAQLGDYFVLDAFGAIHRNHTSITLLPQLFKKEKRFLGLLVEHELTQLYHIATTAKQPCTLMLGGGKPGSKIPLITPIIKQFLQTNDTLLLCPALAYTVLHYLGKSVGNSLISPKVLDFVPDILKSTQETQINLQLPIDYIVAKNNFDGEISYTDHDEIAPNFAGVSIGAKTTQLFAQILKHSKTIICNGTFGNDQKPETMQSMRQLLEIMTQKNIYSVIGGGDSVGYTYTLGIETQMTYLSTGGGSMLAYLGNKTLPGLDIFIGK